MDEPSPSTAPGAAPTENERTWGMLAHLSALVGLLFPLVGNILGPLLVWLTRRDSSAFIAAHAKEALNFNITVTLAGVVCLFLALIFIGLLLGTALFIAWLVMTLVAAIKASEGVPYHYPLSLRLVK
ncbi:MAG TPA: DUF4870 domain-containing protein [Steroidobacteraceae bacterium]|jgi:uncharacterized Tic20 family protein|nr:DUF4870 domain-containing protein [Steroidobacteraceae bacterium]